MDFSLNPIESSTERRTVCFGCVTSDLLWPVTVGKHQRDKIKALPYCLQFRLIWRGQSFIKSIKIHHQLDSAKCEASSVNKLETEKSLFWTNCRRKNFLNTLHVLHILCSRSSCSFSEQILLFKYVEQTLLARTFNYLPCRLVLC